MKTTRKITPKHKHPKDGFQPSGLDRPVGWLSLVVIAAGLGGAVYLALQFFGAPVSHTLLLQLAKLGRGAAEVAAGDDADPSFFAGFKEEEGAEDSKKEKKDPKLNPDTPPGPIPAGMVWIRGGEFFMGTNHTHRLLADAMPSHLVYVDGFWMDTHEVTNEEFARFVKATGYVTTVERPPPKIEGTPRVDDRKLLTDPWSFVFQMPRSEVEDWRNSSQWWKPVFGASWKHPEGPDSDIKGKEKYPVVQVSWDDAQAYCKWAKKRLPTEAEWEFAARGGLDRKRFVWGDEQDPDGKPAANYWQGEFPNVNLKTDGYLGAAPVGSYKPNGYGLYDVAANAWEWCQDWYQPDYYWKSPARNPRGPSMSLDDIEPTTPLRVSRGGSFLCADNYCQRFVPAARHKSEQAAAWNHTGFRCVRDAK